MDKDEKQELVEIEEAIERAREKTYSKQPRFQENADDFFGAVISWIKAADLEAPDYSARSMRRDQWLRKHALREPHWAFAVNQAVMIDANRRWSLTGGRNQVYRYLDVFHQADDGMGWRHHVKQQARSFRVTDLGAVKELGREGEEGPLRGLYHVDSARCQLTGKMDFPLAYYPPSRKMQKWGPTDFLRIAPNPVDDEAFLGLGYSATSMALELTKVLYAVLMHDQEQVMARMPKGIVLFDGISETQFTQSLESRDADLDARNRAYFGGLFIFFNEGMQQSNMRLVALSQLPASFDRKVFLDQTLYAYAAILGLDPSEIWPVQYGALGRGNETEVQHRKATTKGVYDFSLAHQEALQKELPNTVQFEYEERDAEGDLMDAQIAQAWADVAKTLYEAGQVYGVPLLDQQRSLSILADKIPSVIPPEWTEIEEEITAEDTDAERSAFRRFGMNAMKRLRERAISSLFVQRAIKQWPTEPIVRCFWPGNREVVLWERGDNATKRVVWPVNRQVDKVLYTSANVMITEADVEEAIRKARQRTGADFAALLEAKSVGEVSK